MTIKRVNQELVVEAPITFGVLTKKFIGTLFAGDTTPSVKNLTIFKCVNVSSVIITDFLNGQEGQEIVLLGDGNTEVVDSANLTCTDGGHVLDAGKVYRFTQINRHWYEDA